MPPARGLEPCPAIQLLDGLDGEAILSTAADTATKYGTCAGEKDAWIEWYEGLK